MNITEQKIIDKIEIVTGGILQIRQKNSIIKDSQVISESFYRYVLFPGSDLTGQPDNVVAIANATWTPEVVEAFNNRQSGLPSEITPVSDEELARTNTLGT